MRLSKLVAVLGAASSALAIMAAPAAAGSNDKLTCDGVFAGVNVKDVIVPRNGACTLTDSKVRGEVKVARNAYFQATGTSVKEDVEGHSAQTIFIDTGSNVRGDVEADKTAQVFIFNAKVTGSIQVRRATDKVQICGTTVRKGDIDVERSGRDILIGDPLAIDCDGNDVKQGDVSIEDNDTDVELVVRGNQIRRGNLEVSGNDGPSGKFVEGNTGGRTLKCKGNDSPFSSTGNTGWRREKGQCA